MNGVNNDDSNDLGPMSIDIWMLIEDTVVELFMFISLIWPSWHSSDAEITLYPLGYVP